MVQVFHIIVSIHILKLGNFDLRQVFLICEFFSDDFMIKNPNSGIFSLQ